jgi:hypothetical protein
MFRVTRDWRGHLAWQKLSSANQRSSGIRGQLSGIQYIPNPAQVKPERCNDSAVIARGYLKRDGSSAKPPCGTAPHVCVAADTSAAVLIAIQEMLENLPQKYSNDDYRVKCDAVYQHVYDSYYGAGLCTI